jgi:hypothetical protein
VRVERGIHLLGWTRMFEVSSCAESAFGWGVNDAYSGRTVVMLFFFVMSFCDSYTWLYLHLTYSEFRPAI